MTSGSSASDYSRQDNSDLSFVRDRALKDVKRVLGSMENLSKSVYNTFALYNFRSKRFSQNRVPCDCVDVPEATQSHNADSIDGLSSFTKCCIHEVRQYYKKDT